MSTNSDALKMIKYVRSTPGYTVERQDNNGRYKLIRLPLPDYGVLEASVTVSSKASGQQHQNEVHRTRNKIGWSQELYEHMESIERNHRLAGTDPDEEQTRFMLAYWGVQVPSEAEPEEQTNQPERRRVSKGTATGSARSKASLARPAQSATAEAPAHVLSNVGRMQPERITPERALDLVTKLAPYQRKLDEKKFKEYAAAMQRGEWVLNPADPICIDTNGQTANGQHRLRACVEAEVPFDSWVAYDTAPTTYAVMDHQKTRTMGDMFYGQGEENSNMLASAARFAYLWFEVPDQSNWARTPKVTEAQGNAIIQKHPDLRVSVKYGRISRVGISTQASMLTHYLVSQKMGGDHRLVTRWYKALSGMELGKRQPGHTLGLYLMGGHRRVELEGRPKRDLHMYLLMRAWNNTCLGKTMASVGWKSGDNGFVIPEPITPREGRHGFPPLD